MRQNKSTGTTRKYYCGVVDSTVVFFTHPPTETKPHEEFDILGCEVVQGNDSHANEVTVRLPEGQGTADGEGAVNWILRYDSEAAAKMWTETLTTAAVEEEDRG
jgi:hypothetical protein